jgi:hypothetical protein
MYGEEDAQYVIKVMRIAASTGGTLIRLGNGSARSQHAYVGNVAWAFVCADQTLRTADSAIGGHPFFINDDTPVMNVFRFSEPYLQVRGYRTSTLFVPYWLAFVCFYLLEVLVFIAAPVYQLHFKMCLDTVIYLNLTVYFSYAKANTMFGYTPIYSPEVAEKRSMVYYRQVEL